ncbi:hypothetical protein BCN_0780 [Bacillus cereus NC7401]|nr:hypothetical protein BCN_0780 [Bacillus cereus NC7401]
MIISDSSVGSTSFLRLLATILFTRSQIGLIAISSPFI